MPAVIPREKKDPRPHRTAMERAAATAVQRAVMIENYSGDPGELTLTAYKNRHGIPEDTLSELREYQKKDSAAYKDIRTWTGAVWALREAEQKVTDLKRAEYVARYRPIQTLDGLDPHWQRKYFRDAAASVAAWRASALRARWANHG